MKILSVEQIREADQFTIDNEPIASIDLMERAAAAFAHWFHERYLDLFEGNRVAIVCGMGNNGGDGLAVARLLHRLEGFGLSILIVEHDVDLVMKLSDHVVVMHQGAKLSQGHPDVVRADPAVQAAYFGQEVQHA
jgi:NAD(P)H-hydrate repair Nnr-like enzyme with NAD(P)H-hydrate epimerase domain